MTLRLYDTATRTVRDFVPLVPGKVSMYGCGLTVQGAPHVGHIRFGLDFDMLTRWLEYRGYEVTFCRNVTDIDDKILARRGARTSSSGVAGSNERASDAAYELLGCLPPTVEPRATGHIPEMIEMMQTLIERGHAYAADGDVYFDVRSFPDYGALSGQKLDEMQPAATTRATRRQPSATRATSRCGRAPSRASRRGRARGVPAVPAGTWSARRWRTGTSAPRSTSTAAASI